MRTFETGCEDPTKLSSPQDRVLSPLADASMASDEVLGAAAGGARPEIEEFSAEIRFPGSWTAAAPEALRASPQGGSAEAAAAGLAAPEGAASGSAGATMMTPVRHGHVAATVPDSVRSDASGEVTGEVTGNVASLASLLKEDEEYAARFQASVAAPKRSLPSKSPGMMSEASELPEDWDLFAQFKKQGCPARPSGVSVADEAPLASARSEGPRNDDTVDMAGVVGAIEGFAGGPISKLQSEESEVPEARRSFATRVGKFDNPVAVMPCNRHRAVPTPSRSRSTSLGKSKSPAATSRYLGWVPTPRGEEAEGKAPPSLFPPVPSPSSRAGPGPSPPGSAARTSPRGTGNRSPHRSPAAQVFGRTPPRGCRSPGLYHGLPIAPPLPQQAASQLPQQQQAPPRWAASPGGEGSGQLLGDSSLHFVNMESAELCGASEFEPIPMQQEEQLHQEPRQPRPEAPRQEGPQEDQLEASFEAYGAPQQPQKSPQQSPQQRLSGQRQLEASFEAYVPPEARNEARASFATQLGWETFLGHCGIAFPPLEDPQASQPPAQEEPMVDMQKLGGAAATCPRAKGAVEALAQERGVCLDQAVRELSERNEAAQHQHQMAVLRWNSAAQTSAGELMDVLEEPAELEGFRGRIKNWQTFCKDEAWLKWYAAKREWLLKDLKVLREHSSGMARELGGLREQHRRLDHLARQVGASLRQHKHRADLRRCGEKLRDLAAEERQVVEDDRELMAQKAPELQSKLEAERRSVAELERRLEEAKLGAQQDQEEIQQVQKAYLQQKAHRVGLETQRYARTCQVHRATATKLDLVLRGGAGLSIVRGSDVSGDVQLTLRLKDPSAPAAGAYAELCAALFACAWRSILGLTGGPSEGKEKSGEVAVLRSASEAHCLRASVPCGSVPRLVRILDHAAVRIEDQLRALRTLPKECPEVADVKARLREGTDGAGPALLLAVTLVVVRSHALVGMPSVLAPKVRGWENADKVDAAECVLELASDVDAFPEAIVWSDISVRQILGRGEAPAVERALRSLQDDGSERAPGPLLEVLSVAAQVMRRAAPSAGAAALPLGA